MRQADVCALPSFYEGLQAYACGCRLVAADLEGIRRELAPELGSALRRVPAPPMVAGRVDVPEAGALPAFAQGPVEPEPRVLERFSWGAVFARVESVWRRLSAGARRGESRSGS